ncbi:S8 family serine peptidase [Nostoc sp. CHAB 5834]|nr:S8 family serine peptidase [Nostoc sp. CHAB 5834]
MKTHIPIHGSAHRVLQYCQEVDVSSEPQKKVGQAKEKLRVSVWIRSNSQHNWKALAEEILSTKTQKQREENQERLNTIIRASSEDIQQIVSFAHMYNLDVLYENPDCCRIVIEGAPEDFERAFQVSLRYFRYCDGIYRAYQGTVHVPEALAEIIDYVSGLDNLPLFQQYKHGVNLDLPASDPPMLAKYLPKEIAALYHFPSSSDLNREVIGIMVPFGGFLKDDMKAYFSDLGLQTPEINVVGSNKPADKVKVQKALQGEIPRTPEIAATIETTMDIQLLGALANGAKIVVYIGEGFDVSSILHLLTQVATDVKYCPRVLSGSWGVAEEALPEKVLDLLDKQLLLLASRGVSICFSSGDGGSTSLPSNSNLIPTYPASSAYVLACGGTYVESNTSVITQETVWNSGKNASGGGFSARFPMPWWQSESGIKDKFGNSGRGVPDVSANAAKESGCKLLVADQNFVSSGTSAAAPLWAALLAILNSKLGTSVGFFNPVLYRPEIALSLRDITIGNNNIKKEGGLYHAQEGWDACTGWGSPNGEALLTALKTFYSNNLG